MKILLIGFNVQEDVYPLTLSYLKNYSNKFHHDVDIKIKEFSIGNRIDFTVNKTIEMQVLSYILLQNPEAVGFSCYIWNISVVKTIARLLRRINPNIKIFLGGVEIDKNSLDKNIDYIMTGEGEVSLKELIDFFKGNKKITEVSSICHKEKNKIIENKEKQVDQLDELVNPYLTSNKKRYTTIRLETSRGCPFNCKYCYYASYTKIREFSISYLKKYIKYIFENYEFKYLTIIDANININKKRMIKILDIVSNHIESSNKKIKVAFELKPELIDKELIEELSKYEFEINAELGLQSTNPSVMTNCNRPYDLEKVKQGLKLLDRSKINYKIDLMYGLPEDDFFKFLNSSRFILNNAKKQNQLPAHHFMLLNNTSYAEEINKKDRIDETNSSMVIKNDSQNVIDLFKTKLFVEMINEELKLLK